MLDNQIHKLAAAAMPLLLFLFLAGAARPALAQEDEVFPKRLPPPPAVTAAPPLPQPAVAASVRAPAEDRPYHIQPGDVLTVSVWKESDLQADVYVRPDGGLSFPLAGDIPAAGHSVEEVRSLIDKRLRRVIAEPEVTVSVKQIGGNLIYVVGKVNKPGNFPLNGPIDVLQALSLAGGTTAFASLNDIRIIRRDGGQPTSIAFRYHDIERGRSLEQNILLHSGDTVVVP